MNKINKKYILEVCIGLIALAVAFIAKPSGWNVQNALIWLAICAGTYFILRLSIMLPGIVRDVRSKNQ